MSISCGEEFRGGVGVSKKRLVCMSSTTNLVTVVITLKPLLMCVRGYFYIADRVKF